MYLLEEVEVGVGSVIDPVMRSVDSTKPASSQVMMAIIWVISSLLDLYTKPQVPDGDGTQGTVNSEHSLKGSHARREMTPFLRSQQLVWSVRLHLEIQCYWFFIQGFGQ